ncbi:MAG: alpha/beta hydrolase [Acidobacteriota bacterium]
MAIQSGLDVVHSELDVVQRGKGDPVLLIHGTGATSDFWGEAADRLAQYCRVVTYDRRGTGRSSARPSGHHDLHAEDAAEIIRRLGLGPMTIVGWSMGGIVALYLAHRHPELVRSLVLQEAPLYARHDYSLDILRGFAPVIALSKLGMKSRAAERFNRWTYSSGGTGYDQWPDAWKEATHRNAEAICTEIDIGTGEQVLTPSQVREIKHPVLGLLGEVSQPYYRRAMVRIGKLLPQLQVKEIPKGNHAMHIDGEAAWTEAVVGEGLPPTASQV